MNSHKKYLFALSLFNKFGAISLSLLQKHFKTTKDAYFASPDQLIKARITQKSALEFTNFRKTINLEEKLELLNKESIKVITKSCPNYPRLLKEISNPPEILFYKGQLNSNNFAISVVGSRKYTSYGKMSCEYIVKNLTKNNICIISGLALGIDSIAHATCLDAGGTTLAVLGTGIDRNNIYPRTNLYLSDKILANNGAIISEFPPKTPGLPHNFPLRNRIIAGLSLGTLIVEAEKKSGTLITAQLALDQNREVFAIPGNIFSPNSFGPNNLIKQGAKITVNANDIIEELDLSQVNQYIDNTKIIGETKEEIIILKHLSHESVHINKLSRLTNLSISSISSTLTLMEIKGMVKNIGNMQYVLAR